MTRAAVHHANKRAWLTHAILLPCLASAAAFMSSSSHAAPNVATDILPVHSLVSRVMDGLGEPELFMSPGVSPHSYSLKPSEAKTLEQADLVFWIGEDLSPFLTRSIANLAPDATSIALLETEGTTLLPFRTGSTFEVHEHDEHEGHDDHEDHDEHAEHSDHDDHDEHDAHSDHDDHEDHEDHDHEAHDAKGEHDDHHDAHAWLDPENAKVWLDVIARELAASDPDNAAAYFKNAEEGRTELDALIVELNEQLEPVRGQAFIVFHDAYHYFEERFSIEAAGAISLSDGTTPGPARIREIQERLAETDAHCVFREPQFASGLVAVVTDGTDVQPGILDPIGATLEPGKDLYPNLLRGLAGSLTSCLS